MKNGCYEHFKFFIFKPLFEMIMLLRINRINQEFPLLGGD